MFRLVAIVLATALSLPAEKIAEPDNRAIALVIPTGVMVRIKTTSKQSIEGRLNAITPESVTLQVLVNDQIAVRTVPFAEMRSIKQSNKPMPAGKQVLITLGVAIGG